MLVERVHVVDVLHRLDVALGEASASRRRDPSLGHEAGGDPVEYLPVLLLDRRQVRLTEDALDHEVPVSVELLELLDSEARHPSPPRAVLSRQAIRAAGRPRGTSSPFR